MSSEFAIKVDGVGKNYHIYDKPHHRLLQMLPGNKKDWFRDFWALKDVSFTVGKGETVGIIGRNGSGKSTLLQMICGTLTPTTGSIEVNGRVAALLELGAGFNPEFTGRENVYMAASLYGLTQEEIAAKMADIIAFADIASFMDQPVKTYSSGMYVRLAFAVIAHVDADILVVDEALAVGDVVFTQKCMRFLRQFMQTGTVLFVSHDTNSVKSLCNRVVWLDGGQMLQDGEPKEVCELYLEACYESQQGKSSIDAFNVETDVTKEGSPHFDADVAAFGSGAAQILDARLLDGNGNPILWVRGGEALVLRIDIQTHKELNAPIVGFYVKDRLGQILFGDNTFLYYQNQTPHCPPGRMLLAEFAFCMPLLSPGVYSITISIANGTQDVHEQCHWIHDAIVFRSERSSVASGLVGIPMLSVTLNLKPDSGALGNQ